MAYHAWPGRMGDELQPHELHHEHVEHTHHSHDVDHHAHPHHHDVDHSHPHPHHGHEVVDHHSHPHHHEGIGSDVVSVPVGPLLKGGSLHEEENEILEEELDGFVEEEGDEFDDLEDDFEEPPPPSPSYKRPAEDALESSSKRMNYGGGDYDCDSLTDVSDEIRYLVKRVGYLERLLDSFKTKYIALKRKQDNLKERQENLKRGHVGLRKRLGMGEGTQKYTPLSYGEPDPIKSYAVTIPSHHPVMTPKIKYKPSSSSPPPMHMVEGGLSGEQHQYKLYLSPASSAALGTNLLKELKRRANCLLMTSFHPSSADYERIIDSVCDDMSFEAPPDLKTNKSQRTEVVKLLKCQMRSFRSALKASLFKEKPISEITKRFSSVYRCSPDELMAVRNRLHLARHYISTHEKTPETFLWEDMYQAIPELDRKCLEKDGSERWLEGGDTILC